MAEKECFDCKAYDTENERCDLGFQPKENNISGVVIHLKTDNCPMPKTTQKFVKLRLKKGEGKVCP